MKFDPHPARGRHGVEDQQIELAAVAATKASASVGVAMIAESSAARIVRAPGAEPPDAASGVRRSGPAAAADASRQRPAASRQRAARRGVGTTISARRASAAAAKTSPARPIPAGSATTPRPPASRHAASAAAAHGRGAGATRTFSSGKLDGAPHMPAGDAKGVPAAGPSRRQAQRSVNE